jgi:hypothetical protein
MPELVQHLAQELEKMELNCQRSRDGADYRY